MTYDNWSSVYVLWSRLLASDAFLDRTESQLAHCSVVQPDADLDRTLCCVCVFVCVHVCVFVYLCACVWMAANQSIENLLQIVQ